MNEIEPGWIPFDLVLFVCSIFYIRLYYITFRLLLYKVVDNIRLFNQETTEEKIKEAAEKACIHTEIGQLEYGYETEIGERRKSFVRWSKTALKLIMSFCKRSLGQYDFINDISMHSYLCTKRYG